VFNAEHLRRILAEYVTYYNKVRTHGSLGRTPIDRFREIVARPILGGLHHRYARILVFRSDMLQPTAGPRYPFLLAHKVGCGIMSGIDFDFSFRRIISE
jgi:hypothetical protein